MRGDLEVPGKLVDALRRAERIVVLTGAGISAESGIPTFRDAQSGLWARFLPEDLATPQAFQRNPRRVWEWYAWRRAMIARSAPNAAHLALVEIARRVPSFTLITQNIDGMHQRAGSPEVLELHGNIFRARCSLEDVVCEPAPEDVDSPPSCPNCGAALRPDVVWFGESLPPEILDRAVEAARQADLFLSVGTSNEVEPAASLGRLALRHGAVAVEINPAPTSFSEDATFVLRGRAGSFLPRLARLLAENG